MSLAARPGPGHGGQGLLASRPRSASRRTAPASGLAPMRPASTGPYHAADVTRPLVTALAALALIAVAAACSLPSIGARPVYDDSNWASYPQVTQLLAHRTQAMLKRDEKAYLQDLDPKAHDLVAHERMVFANLRQLQFAQLGGQAMQRSGDVVLGPAPSNPGRPESRIPDVDRCEPACHSMSHFTARSPCWGHSGAGWRT